MNRLQMGGWNVTGFAWIDSLENFKFQVSAKHFNPKWELLRVIMKGSAMAEFGYQWVLSV